jgi:hypothetical protein
MDDEERKELAVELNLKYFGLEQKFTEIGELYRDIARLRIRLQKGED